MKADVRFSKESLTQAFKLHYNTKYPVRSRLMLIFGLALVLIGSLFIFMDFPKNPPLLKFLILFVGFVYVLLFLYRRKKLFERAANQKTFQGEFTFELNKKGLAFGKNDGVSKCDWSNISEIIQDENAILFYFGENKFYILPLGCLNSKQKQLALKAIDTYYEK